MAMTKFIQDGNVIDYAAAANVEYRDVVAFANRIGVACEPIAAGETGAVALTGVFEMPSVNTAISAGAAVYWDVNNKRITGTDTDNVPAGMCVATKASGTTVIRVRIG